MQDSIQIKIVTESELHSLVRLVLENEMYLSTVWPHIGDYYRTPTIIRQLQEVLRERDSDIWGLYAKGCLIGAVFVDYEESDSVELGYFVAESWSGLGVATTALTKLGDRFINKGFRVTVRVSVNNQSSIQVIQKAGFILTQETESELIFIKVHH